MSVSNHSSKAKPRMLRVNNVSKRLGIPERTVRYMAAHGRIPAFKSGRRAWSFYAADFDAHIADAKRETA